MPRLYSVIDDTDNIWIRIQDNKGITEMVESFNRESSGSLVAIDVFADVLEHIKS